MPDFVNQYQPPGVYVEEETSPLVAVVGTTPSVVGLLGPSIGYRTHTEAVTLTGTAPVTLSKLGVDIATNFEVRSEDGTVLPTVGDYVLDIGGGEDADEDTETDNTATIARVALGDIGDGDTVFVSYRYTDTAYHSPHRFRDFDDVRDYYGEAVDTVTNAVVSPVSLAAKVAFENGAREVVIVATTGTDVLTSRGELEAAYDKLSTYYDVRVIVPLPVGLTGTAIAPGDVVNVAADLATWISGSISGDDILRVGLIGFESSITVAPETIAAGTESSRVGILWPNGLNYYNGATNTVLEVAGYYLAAAAAGVMVNNEVQIPLTRKQIRGFTGIPAAKAATLSKSNKDLWSSSGVMVVEIDRQGRLVVRHGTSSDPTSVLTRELSLVRARDEMVTSIHDTVDASGLIGSAIDEETPIRVKGVIAGVLETLVSAGTIVAYQSLKVRQKSLDPTIIEVKFEYRPAYPLNYIVVSFQVNTITGETTMTDLLAA